MSLDFASILEHFRGAFFDVLAYELLLGLLGLLGTLLVHLRAKRKGLSPSVTYGFLGASLGIGGMVILAAILVWSVKAFLVIALVSLFVMLCSAVVGRGARERNRLSKYPLG